MHNDERKVAETPESLLCFCIQNNFNNNSFSPSGQDREVSIWGDVRPQRVFSKARNPSGIFFRPRSSAEHPSANSHQSVAAKGNACKVYFKTQCDFTLLPSTGWGERRGGRVSHCCLFPHTMTKSLSSWLISISDLYQEAQLGTGIEKDTAWLTVILTWYRFNGKVFQ